LGFIHRTNNNNNNNDKIHQNPTTVSPPNRQTNYSSLPNTSSPDNIEKKINKIYEDRKRLQDHLYNCNVNVHQAKANLFLQQYHYDSICCELKRIQSEIEAAEKEL